MKRFIEKPFTKRAMNAFINEVTLHFFRQTSFQIYNWITEWLIGKTQLSNISTELDVNQKPHI